MAMTKMAAEHGEIILSRHSYDKAAGWFAIWMNRILSSEIGIYIQDATQWDDIPRKLV